MSILPGNQTDYSFSRDGDKLVIISKADNSIVEEVTGNLTTVEFEDGSTIDLTQSFDSRVANSSTLFYSSPASTELADGGYVLVWEHYGWQDEDVGEGVTLQQFDATGKLVKQTLLVSGEAEDPSVSATPDGGYIVVWSAEAGSTTSVRLQQFDSAGNTKGSLQTVASSKGAELQDATVKVLANGNYIVSWASTVESRVSTTDQSLDWSDGQLDGKYDAETGDLYAQLYSASGSKIGSVQKVSGNTVTNSVPDDQVILPGAAPGEFLIAYTVEKITSTNQWGESQYDSSLYVRSFNADGTAKDSAPLPLQSHNTNYPNATYYSLIKTDDGYLATWVGTPTNSVGRTLITQAFDAQLQATGQPTALAALSGTNANDASLTLLEGGNYLAVWSTYEFNTANTTYASLLDADLNSIGNRFVVHAQTNPSYEAKTTALKDGGFAITWTSGNTGQFGDTGSELFSQRYDANGQPVGNVITTISGDDNDNSLTWLSDQNVTLVGGAGDDRLTGGSGSNTLLGGQGTDTAVYDGDQAEYKFSLDADGDLIVLKGSHQDRLESIETLEFTDGNIRIDDGSLVLEGSSTSDSETPATTLLKDGSQVVIWKQGDDVLIQSVRDGYWNEPIASGIEFERGSLGIAALGDGFIITWGDYEGHALNAQRFDVSGQPAGQPIQLTPVDATRVVDDISATELIDGSFVLSWTEETPDVWIPEQQQYTESQGQAHIQLFNANGTPKGAPVALASGSLQAFEPSVSALQNGGFVVAWEYVNEAKESEEIYLQRFKADGSLDGKAIQVNSGTRGDQGDPEVVTLNDGSYVVVWTRETDNDQVINGERIEVTEAINIFMQRYGADGKKLGTETQVNSTNGFYNDPSITALKGGGYVVTWATSDERDVYNGTSTLYAQVFDSSGAKIGGEQVVASSSNQDYFPSVSASADGGFLVVWEAAGREGFNWGQGDILARRFDANGNSLTLSGDENDNTLTWIGSSGVVLDGGAGDDRLVGGDGDDILIGGSGSNNLIGGKGNDIYIIENASDIIEEQANGGIDTVRSSVSYTLGQNLENLVLSGTGDIDGTGNTADNRITGNSGNNRLDGGAGADTLIGGDGDDTYVVDNLKDVIIELAGEGIDSVESSVSWTLGDNLENLTLTGTAAINGTGNALDNVLIGNSANNTLNGGAGDDILDGGAGVDKLIGGSGDDTYIVDLVMKGSGAKATVVLEDTVTEAANGGEDQLILRGEVLTEAASTLTLAANLEHLDASETGLTRLNLTGNALNNTLIGNDSDNVLDGKAGIDTMIGGKGNDTYVLDREEELELLTELADEGNDTLRIGYGNTSKTEAKIVDLNQNNLRHIENVQLAGSGLFEVLGNEQNNTLDAGKLAAVLKGGAGNDTYIVGHKDAQVIEETGEGDEDLVQSTISWTLGDNLENLTLLGKAALNGTGNELINLLIGNDGNNILDGGLNTTGFDTLKGGKGNDTYIVRNVGDIVEEEANAGIDTVKAYFSYALTSNVENLILEGSDHINGTGNDLKNVITGNAGNNVLDGGAGTDKLIGGKGNDTYIVDLIAKGVGAKATVALEDSITEKPNEGNDTLILRVSDDVLAKLAEASKATTLTLAANLENLDASLTGNLNLNLTGNKDNNIIIGNSGDNILNGGAGDDTLYAGEGGNNILIGGAGADVMHGGSGQDTFRFTSLKDLGLGEGKQDVIWNFTQGEDKLDFSPLKGWNFKGTGEAFAATGTKQLWAEQDGDDLILYGNSAGSVDADFSIKLVGISGLSADDFILS